MASSFLGQKRLRKYYGKIREVLEMPNLIEVQKSSYDLFLNSGDEPIPMDGEGIKGVFQSVFPIKDFNETAVLEFVRYELEKPKYDVEECQQRDMNSAASMSAPLPRRISDTTPAGSSKRMRWFATTSPSSPSRASATAVPTLGWPAKGISAIRVKMRTLRVLFSSSGGSTNVVSE